MLLFLLFIPPQQYQTETSFVISNLLKKLDMIEATNNSITFSVQVSEDPVRNSFIHYQSTKQHNLKHFNLHVTVLRP